MIRWKLYLAILAGLALILSGAYYTYQTHSSLAEARGALRATQARAAAQAAVNEQIVAQARSLEVIANAAEARAEANALRAERAEGKLVVARTVQDSLPAAIEAKEQWRGAYDKQKRASIALRLRGDTLQRANEDLTAVVRDYGNASATIIKASKPSFFSRLIPKVGVGAAAGIDPITRKPATTVGVTLSWEVL